MIGKKLSPALIEMANSLWDYEATKGLKPEYDHEAFKAITKIFMSAMLDKIWELQEKENISQEDRANMAVKCGKELRQFVKTYTDIDTHDFYKML